MSVIFRQGRCIISFLSFSSAKRCLWRSLHQFIIASHYLFLFYFFFCFVFVFFFVLHSHSEAWSSSQKIPPRPLVPILFLETRADPLAIRLSPIESVSIQSGETSKRERGKERERERERVCKQTWERRKEQGVHIWLGNTQPEHYHNDSS